MIPKFRACDVNSKEIVAVARIEFDSETIFIANNNKSINDDQNFGFWQGFKSFILMQSTGVYDKHGVEIFEGDIIQQVHAYDYAMLEIETDFLEPIEVKKGNYVQGKWIAKEVDSKSYSAIRCVFGRDIKVIGNIYENPELLEVTDE